MKRLNHTRGGEPKVTPFGVNTFGELSKDAHKVLVRLSEIRFPETPHCLSYLSARQQWIDWWIRIIQKTVSEAVVTGIEASFAHRARLAQDLAASPRNLLKSPTQRPHIQIADKKWELEAETTLTRTTSPIIRATTETDSIESPGDKPNDHMSEYELQRIRNTKEN